MKIRVKLRKVGDSFGVLIPRKLIKHYNIGDFIDLDIIIKGENIIIKEEERVEKPINVYTKPKDIIIKERPIWYCQKHKCHSNECECGDLWKPK